MTERDFSNKALKRKFEEATGKKVNPPIIEGEELLENNLAFKQSVGLNPHSFAQESINTQQKHFFQDNVESQVEFTTPNQAQQQKRLSINDFDVPNELIQKMGIQTETKNSENQFGLNSIVNVPTMVIDLPSGERFYGNLIPQGKVKIKSLEQKELDILNTEHLVRKNIAFEKAIDSCILEPKVSINSMITGDRIYVVFKIFELSKGTSEYTFTQKCPNCGQKNRITLDFNTDFEVKRLDLEKNSFTTVLPISKRKVTYHLLTGNERKEVENKIKLLMAQVSSSKLIDTTSTEMLIKCIDEIEGVPNSQKMEFVKHMVYADVVHLRKHIDSNTPGVNPIFEFLCVNCSYEDKMILPITSSFFGFEE